VYTKRERLAEILRRLDAAPSAGSDEAALALVRDVINAVEDELSGLPYDAAEATMLAVSERMYPPLADSEIPDIMSGVRRFRTFRHELLVGANGAILIRRMAGTIELSKPGADGKRIAP
jgi:hypothetical protein